MGVQFDHVSFVTSSLLLNELNFGNRKFIALNGICAYKNSQSHPFFPVTTGLNRFKI